MAVPTITTTMTFRRGAAAISTEPLIVGWSVVYGIQPSQHTLVSKHKFDHITVQ